MCDLYCVLFDGVTLLNVEWAVVCTTGYTILVCYFMYVGALTLKSYHGNE